VPSTTRAAPIWNRQIHCHRWYEPTCAQQQQQLRSAPRGQHGPGDPFPPPATHQKLIPEARPCKAACAAPPREPGGAGKAGGGWGCKPRPAPTRAHHQARQPPPTMPSARCMASTRGPLPTQPMPSAMVSADLNHATSW
jgi:hypothetical protein